MTKLDKPVSKMKQGHIMLMPEKGGKKGPLVKENLHISSLRCIDLSSKVQEIRCLKRNKSIFSLV